MSEGFRGIQAHWKVGRISSCVSGTACEGAVTPLCYRHVEARFCRRDWKPHFGLGVSLASDYTGFYLMALNNALQSWINSSNSFYLVTLSFFRILFIYF